MTSSKFAACVAPAFAFAVAVPAACVSGCSGGSQSADGGASPPAYDSGDAPADAPLSGEDARDGTVPDGAPADAPADGNGDSDSGSHGDGDASGDASASPQPCVPSNGVVTLTLGNVRLDVNLGAGTATFSYGGVAKIANFYAAVQLDSYVTSRAYASRSCAVLGNAVTVTSTGGGLPTMTQRYVLDGGNHILTQVAVSGSGLASNWISPLVTDAPGDVDVAGWADPRVLWIPFDNDAWVTFDAQPMNGSGTSYEASAFYDNTSRNGIVVGSVTHDTWKSGVYYQATNASLAAMHVFGGATDPTFSHDPLPHGKVSGASIASPVVFAGYASDWRDLMEEYADANAARQPKLPWSGGVPFGWNSWGKLQTKISHDSAVAVSDFIASMQPAFSNGGVVYVNLDSYWDNLSVAQLQDFVNHCHANHQKAGIYWTPFVDWGLSATRAVEGSSTATYGEIWLRDAMGNPISLDGAYAVDPTHPATKGRIDYFIDEFKAWGFEYVKLDFLSHGALESTVRADPSVQTGVQAYNEGMEYIVNRIGGSMFISESIAPLFPGGYGHARRISCDVNGAAVDPHGASYELNSVTYGWWMSGRTYAYNDPDMVVFEGYTADDNLTRLLSAVLSGTVFLDGDDLTEPTGQALARAYLTVPRLNGVAQLGRTFRPVEGNTGTSPSDVFVLQDGTTTYLAVFDFGSAAQAKVVDLARAGLVGTKTYAATDLWSGSSSSVTGTLTVTLDAGAGRVFALE
jgi:hypothetical protein